MTPPDCPATVHGTRYAYRAGCTHPEARRAHLAYVKAWRRTPVGRAMREREYAARRLPRPTPAETRHARRVATAVTMWERGARLTDIARELGCSRRTVERYISPARVTR
jgi:DNA-binding CsgD family transcriptional regulator